MYHGENRGAISLNLLSGVTNPPVNEDPSMVQSFTLAVDNVSAYKIFIVSMSPPGLLFRLSVYSLSLYLSRSPSVYGLGVGK